MIEVVKLDCKGDSSIYCLLKTNSNMYKNVEKLVMIGKNIICKQEAEKAGVGTLVSNMVGNTIVYILLMRFIQISITEYSCRKRFMAVVNVQFLSQTGHYMSIFMFYMTVVYV